MKKGLYISVSGVLLTLTILAFSFKQPFNKSIFTTPHIDTLMAVDTLLIKPEPMMLYGYEIDSMTIIKGQIKRNQYLSQILQNYNVPYKKILELSKVSKKVFDVRKIAPYKHYTLICYSDSLCTAKAMIYEPNALEYVVFNFEDSVSIKRFERKIDTLEKQIFGSIDMSLAVSIDELGGSPELTNKIVDVLAWQIDFYALQKGDEFKVIYEDKQVENKSVGIGTIKGVYFKHFGNDYYAYSFNQGNGVDYFDGDGKSLRRALLKYPLEFTRISSRYSGNRFHPVQKRWKSHRGTDFAAPKGTPIRAVGDGIITQATYSKYNGNYVKLKHNANISTQYLHMSKIASGIKRGVKVKQGQTIGYVGSTGLATGNHLCYRFWKNGVQVDALKVDIPPSEPVQDSNQYKFALVKDRLKKQLEQINTQNKTANQILNDSVVL